MLRECVVRKVWRRVEIGGGGGGCPTRMRVPMPLRMPYVHVYTHVLAHVRQACQYIYTCPYMPYAHACMHAYRHATDGVGPSVVTGA